MTGIIRSMHRFFICFIRVMLLFLLVGCTPATLQASPTSTPAGRLTPYRTHTPTLTPTIAELTTPTLQPTATSTPRTYVVQPGDLISGIAYAFGITTEDLLAANPTITPNAMSAGTVLIIPAVAPTPTGFVPSPTPALLILEQPICYPQQDGGAWCFVRVSNPLESGVENVSVELRVSDSQGNLLFTQTAFSPLNIIPPGGSLPLLAAFPAGIPLDAQVSAQQLTGLQVPPGDTRYLSVTVNILDTELVSNGLAAEISGEFSLAVEGETAQRVWLAAIAYDASDKIVGVRLWKSNSPLASGSSQLFTLRVYSVSGPIVRVEVLAEGQR